MKRWFAFALLAGLTMTNACDDDEDDLCEAKCECQGCSARQYDDCLYDYENKARSAEFRNCYDFYDAWLACQADTHYCRNGHDFEDSCGPERHRLDDCID
jgi:hypothetical protein